MSLLHDRPVPPDEEFQSDESAGFWQRFERAFDQRADEVSVDRLHPLKVMGWSLEFAGHSWPEFLERADRGVQSMVVKSLEYSLRDASVGLPIVDWLEIRQQSLRDFFLDSVDAVEEEAVSPLSPLYQPIERLWWQELAKKRTLRFGLRPLRTDPYAFLSWRVTEAERLLMLGHVRYYYRGFADHRFELAMSLPLTHGVALDIGTAYQFGQHDEQKKIVLKLFKPLKRGGIVHVGAEVQKSPTVIAGVSLPL